MDNAKVNEVLDGVVQLLQNNDYFVNENAKPIRLHPERTPEVSFPAHAKQALQHALWMALEARAWGSERVEEKRCWLGFIQGILWMTGEQTIEESKNTNKSEGG